MVEQFACAASFPPTHDSNSKAQRALLLLPTVLAHVSVGKKRVASFCYFPTLTTQPGGNRTR